MRIGDYLMYINFKKILSKQEKSKIPKEIIKQLNKALPEGLEYVEIGENACGITAQEGLKISIEGLIPQIPENCSNLIKNSKDLSEYLYRTQTTLKLIPKEDDVIIINGNKIQVSDFVKFPNTGNSIKNFSAIYLTPKTFPKIGSLEFKADSITKIIKMHRVPYDNMKITAIESEDDTWLKVRILINEDTNDSSFSFTFRLEVIESVKELIEALKFNNGIFENKISISGYNVGGKINSDKVISNEMIEFWGKVLKLEQILELNFNCRIPIKDNDQYDLETLFKSFIDRKTYREDIDVKSDTGIYLSDKKNAEKSIGNEIAFYFIEINEYNIMSQTFKIYSVSIIFNAVLDSVQEIKESGTEHKYFFRLISAKNKEMFRAIKLFKTYEEAEAYQLEMNKDLNSYAKILIKSEKIIN